MSTQTRNWRQKVRHYLTARNFLIFVLVILCAIEFRAFLIDLSHTLESDNLFFNYRQGHMVYTPNHLTPNDIQPWMTFSYINFVFKLPSGYLENELHLSGPYPNIQITRYARMNHMNLLQLLTDIRQEVGLYKPD